MIVRSLIGAATKFSPKNPRDPAVAEMFARASETASGIRVTPEQALRVGAIYACISIIAESIGAMPVHLFERDGRFRVPADGHPAVRVLTQQANPEVTAGEFWEQMTGWKLLRGNALAYIERDSINRPLALWPIPWNRVTPARAPSGRLVYLVNLGGFDYAGDTFPRDEQVGLIGDEVLHIRDFGFGGVGLSRVQLMAEAAGLALAAEQYGGTYFANDATPGGFISVPQKLSDEEWEEQRGRWNKLHQGARRSHMIGILENGADWKQAGLSAKDAQLIELRGFQIEELARWFRVPLHEIQHVSPVTSWGSGIEQLGIGFVTRTLLPHLNRHEEVAGAQLLSEDGSIFMRFAVDGLLRGDAASRYAVYAIGKQWGILSTNDIHALENMPPVPGGDTYWQPLNFVPAGTEVGALLSMLERLGPEAASFVPEVPVLAVSAPPASPSMNGEGARG
jgi:HK97 family phage portal protein